MWVPFGHFGGFATHCPFCMWVPFGHFGGLYAPDTEATTAAAPRTRTITTPNFAQGRTAAPSPRIATAKCYRADRRIESRFAERYHVTRSIADPRKGYTGFA